MALLVPNHHVIVPNTADIAFTANTVSSGLTDTIQIELFGDSIMCGRDPDVAAPLCGVCSPGDPDIARVPEPPARLLEIFLPQYKLFITTRSQGNSTSGQLLNGNDGVNDVWPDNIEADIVIINHGMNDAKTGIPVAEYKQNLISLRQGLRSNQIMIWQTPTVNKYWDTSLYASAMREVAAMYGDLVADAHEFKTSFIGDIPDGLHPRQLGYAKLIDLCLSPKVNAAILRHITNQIPANTPHKFYRRDHQDKFVLENEDQVALSFTPMSHRWVEVYYRDNISFRAVSRGLYDTGGILTSGVWDAKTGRKLVNTSRSYNLVKIRREDGKLIYNKNFDVYGNIKESAALAAALNATSSDYIVVITTYDEPKTNRLTVGLLEAMYRCGASPEIFAAPLFKLRSSYILVGIPGCGPGKGIEAYNGQVDAMVPCGLPTPTPPPPPPSPPPSVFDRVNWYPGGLFNIDIPGLTSGPAENTSMSGIMTLSNSYEYTIIATVTLISQFNCTITPASQSISFLPGDHSQDGTASLSFSSIPYTILFGAGTITNPDGSIRAGAWQAQFSLTFADPTSGLPLTVYSVYGGPVISVPGTVYSHAVIGGTVGTSLQVATLGSQAVAYSFLDKCVTAMSQLVPISLTDSIGLVADTTLSSSLSPMASGNLLSTSRKPKPKFYTIGETWSEWSTLLNTYSIWEDTISGKIVSVKRNVSSYLNGTLAVPPTYIHSTIGGTVDTSLFNSVQVTGVGVGYGTLNPSASASPIAHWIVNSTLTDIRDSAPTPGPVTLTNILFANIPGTQIPAIKVGTQGISYVSTLNANKLQLSTVLGQSYTIEAWIYAIAPGMIINKDAEYEVAVWHDGTIAVAIDWGTGADVNLPGGGWLLTTATVPFNAASHVAIVVNYTTMYVYINGVLQFTQTGLDRSSQPSINPVVLGNRPGAGQQFTGYIGDVRIWNVVRSAADILGNISGTGLTMWNNVRFDVGVIPFLKNFKPDLCDSPTGDMIVIGGGVTQAQLTALGIQTPIAQLRVVSPGDSVAWSVVFTVEYNCKISYWVWDLNIGITSNITETIYSAVYNVAGRQSDIQSGAVDIPRNFTSTSVMVFGMGDSNDGADDVTFTIESAILQPVWGGQYYQWDVFFPNKETYTFELSADSTANIQITATPGTSNSFVPVMQSINFPPVTSTYSHSVVGGTVGTSLISSAQSNGFGYGTIQQQSYTIPGCGWYIVRMFAADYDINLRNTEYYLESVDQTNWSLMLNTYGIWQGDGDYTWDFFFPESGDYTFNASIDNYGTIYIKEINDPVTVHDYEFVVQVPGYALILTAIKFIKKGWHTIKIN